MVCFRFFGFTSFKDVDDLTIRQYGIMLDALRLKNVDQDYRNHLQAFLNFSVQGVKKVGKREKPVYSTFTKFYDYKKELREAEGKTAEKPGRFSGLSRYLKEKGAKASG